MQKTYTCSGVLFKVLLVAAMPLLLLSGKARAGGLPATGRTAAAQVADSTLSPDDEQVSNDALKAVMDHPSFCCTGNVKTDSIKITRQDEETIIYSCVYSCPCVAKNITRTAYELRLRYHAGQLTSAHINSVMVVNTPKTK